VAWPVRALVVALALLGVGAGLGRGTAGAQSQAPSRIAYIVYLPGWNMISFGDLTSLDSPGLRSVIRGPLYTLQPGDATFTEEDLSKLVPGQSYWAYFTQDSFAFLRQSTKQSYTVDVPANTCVMVGNPSTQGSARVTGADHVYVYSNTLNNYVEEILIGVARGGWACMGAQGGLVTVAYIGDVQTEAWPQCCNPQPVSNGGQARLILKNDSPTPLTIGMAQLDAGGDIKAGGSVAGAHMTGCPNCARFAQPGQCSGGAVTYTTDLAPGVYTLRLQSDAANVPDVVSDITLSPDTSYTVCFELPAGR
jgi:hypothetical protein